LCIYRKNLNEKHKNTNTVKIEFNDVFFGVFKTEKSINTLPFGFIKTLIIRLLNKKVKLIRE